MSPLHMPLQISTTYMHIEENDGYVFIVSPSRMINCQSYLAKSDIGLLHPMIRMKTWSPHNSLTMHGRHTVWWKKGDKTYVVVKAWILERDDAFLYNLLYWKESLWTNTIRLIGGWGTLPHPFNLIRNLKISTITFLRLIGLRIWHKCGVAFKKLFANMISTSKVEREEDIEPFDTDP